MEAGVRLRLRSPRMHNPVVLDGRDHAIPAGPFHWRRRADARLLVARTGGDCDFAAGTHDGDLPRRHTRAVVSIHGIGWLIVDRVTGDGSASADAWWHLHPDWQGAG